MKTSHMSGCRAFSIQNVNEYRNTWLYHTSFWCHHNISPKMERINYPGPVALHESPEASTKASPTASSARESATDAPLRQFFTLFPCLAAKYLRWTQELSVARPQSSTGHNNNLDLVFVRPTDDSEADSHSSACKISTGRPALHHLTYPQTYPHSIHPRLAPGFRKLRY
jgi:hypothetical protein